MTTEATASTLRKTGISAIGDVRWGTHFCYFYETTRDLLETLAQYFKAGLENNEFCVWVVSQTVTVEEARQALEQAVPDLERYLAAGALEIHSHDHWYFRYGRWDPQRVLQSWREKLTESATHGYAGFRGAGDGGWVQNDDWLAFCEYEEQVNAMIVDQPSIILCTYSLTTSPGVQVFDVAHIHEAAVARRNGSWEIIETPELKEAKAEIKRLNEELERKVEERTRELATTVDALRRGEDRIRLVIDTIPTMAWTLSPDGAVDFVNQRWLDYTGLSFEDAIRDPNRIVHPDDLSPAVEKWLRKRAVGDSHEVEVRLRRNDGEYRWFLVRVAPLRDGEGNVVKWYGVSTDIEDRKQAEMQSRALIDAIPHQIWSGPADGTLDYCNERWRSYMGLEQDDLCGHGWQSMLHPDDREHVLTGWQESVANGTPYEQEERHRGADGIYRWFLSRGVPLRDADGRIVRWYGTNTDIEDRKRAEEALSAQALRYKTLMETSTDSIYVLDEKGKLQEANAAFLRRRGYTARAAKGLNVADWDAQWSREHLRERLRRIRQSSAIFETRHRCKDGSLFDVEVCASGVQIAGEQLFFCVARDITGRKQAEDRLRRSEEKFKTLFGIAPVGISVLDRDHNVLDANPALEQIMRLSREKLSSGAWRYRDYLNADGTPRLASERVSERAIRENRVLNNVETGIVMENGETIWVQVSVAPLSLPDASAVVITQDITERKEAEEELKREKEILAKIFGNIPVMIGFVGADGGVKLVNREWERTIGWTLKELRDQNVDVFAEAYPDLSYRQRVLDFVAAATGESTDLKIRVRDGHVIDAACAVVRLSDGTKIAIAQDITERKRAAEALEAANHQLRILSRQLFHIQEEERRHLARELHDEIGQTLTAAKINLQIIEPDVPAKVASRLDDSVQLLDRLLSQVRELSLDLRPPLLDELGLVPTLRWLVDHQAQRAGLGVTFNANLDGLEIEPEVQTTCFRIAQEALTNIIRHSGAKNVALELRHELERLTLRVHDDGGGFDPAAIERRTAPGFTLGLVSMKERALLVRGGFEIHSAPGQGTEIRAWFPVSPDKSPSREIA